MAMTVPMENSQHTSFTLWDIEREFEIAGEAYEQWQGRLPRRRTIWAYLRMSSRDDGLAKALSLGRHIHQLMETGSNLFGSRFEQGDAQCHAVLSAQLLRLQYEIRQPLCDSLLSPGFVPVPYDNIMTAARSIRRTCLKAVREQFARFHSRISAPILPPPRFKVDFCLFAKQMQGDLEEKTSNHAHTKRAMLYGRYDDRERCPCCDACISVTPHSGLPDYRCILFSSHMARDPSHAGGAAVFACRDCYKTFDDSYAFLEHVFQKRVRSSKSCSKPGLHGHWTIHQEHVENDPSVVETCLKNCLTRELTRAKAQKKTMVGSQIMVKSVLPSN